MTLLSAFYSSIITFETWAYIKEILKIQVNWQAISCLFFVPTPSSLAGGAWSSSHLLMGVSWQCPASFQQGYLRCIILPGIRLVMSGFQKALNTWLHGQAWGPKCVPNMIVVQVSSDIHDVKTSSIHISMLANYMWIFSRFKALKFYDMIF